jgi:hypothetical protein
MADKTPEPVTEEYEVVVKVFLTGNPGADFEKAAQNAANDIHSLLTNRTIQTAGCDVKYEVT